AVCSMIIVLMGVAGSGKTTIGRMLARALGWQFIEGDDFHSQQNIDKMRAGVPLTDEDRSAWLELLANQVKHVDAAGSSAVLTCSALRASYRSVLSTASPNLRFVFLRGNFEVIESRLLSRGEHFMKAGMLRGQFDALEEPPDAMIIDVS